MVGFLLVWIAGSADSQLGLELDVVRLLLATGTASAASAGGFALEQTVIAMPGRNGTDRCGKSSSRDRLMLSGGGIDCSELWGDSFQT